MGFGGRGLGGGLVGFGLEFDFFGRFDDLIGARRLIPEIIGAHVIIIRDVVVIIRQKANGQRGQKKANWRGDDGIPKGRRLIINSIVIMINMPVEMMAAVAVGQGVDVVSIRRRAVRARRSRRLR